MSRTSADDEAISPPLRRGSRYKKVSKKAESILDAGQTVPGISPDRKARSASPDSPPMPTPRDTARTTPMAAQSKMARDHYGLGPEKFAIYFWKTPRPKDFLNLPDSRKRWKADVDRAERQKDIDDGADDWDGFDNNISNRGIASCFMKRAKRAFWAGKSWEDFEIQETSLSSQTLGRGGVADPDALDNARRMEIFDAMKERLCEEIWLQPYLGDLPSKNSKPPKATAARSNAVTEKLEPIKEDRADGIVAWSRSREGAAEPWYKGETINPSGLENTMQYYRAQSMAEQAQSWQRSRQQQPAMPPIGNMSIGNPAGRVTTRGVARWPPDFPTSDESKG